MIPATGVRTSEKMVYNASCASQVGRTRSCLLPWQLRVPISHVLVFNLYLLLHVPVLNYEHMMLLILDRKYDALEREVVKVP